MSAAGDDHKRVAGSDAYMGHGSEYYRDGMVEWCSVGVRE